MSYNYRCSDRRNCGARKTLKKPIEQYVRKPMCPSCGKDKLKSVNTREKARNKKRMCNCGECSFPHHMGTEPWCKHAKTGPTDRDYEERYGRR